MRVSTLYCTQASNSFPTIRENLPKPCKSLLYPPSLYYSHQLLTITTTYPLFTNHILRLLSRLTNLTLNLLTALLTPLSACCFNVSSLLPILQYYNTGILA